MRSEQDADPQRPEGQLHWKEISLKTELDQQYLIRACSETIESLRDVYRAGLLLVTLAPAACLLLAFSYLMGLEQLTVAAYCTVVASLLLMFLKWRKSRESAREYYLLFDKACGQVEKMHGLVNRYILDLDRRTSRYFHCVTNTKVTAYFKLRQIESGLAELLDELQAYIRRRGWKRLVRGYGVLQRPFKYYDGLEFNRGKPAEVNLSDLPLTISDLIRSLETGVEELEDEIGYARILADFPGEQEK